MTTKALLRTAPCSVVRGAVAATLVEEAFDLMHDVFGGWELTAGISDVQAVHAAVVLLLELANELRHSFGGGKRFFDDASLGIHGFGEGSEGDGRADGVGDGLDER